MANTTFSSTIRSKSGFKVINESSTTGAITETGFSVNSTGLSPALVSVSFVIIIVIIGNGSKYFGIKVEASIWKN